MKTIYGNQRLIYMYMYFKLLKTKLYLEITKNTAKITTQIGNSSVLGKLLSLCIFCEKRSRFHEATFYD